MQTQHGLEEPQLPCHHTEGGDIKDGSEWRQVPTQGGRRIPSQSPLPSQKPLENKYEALELEGQADDSGEEGPSEGFPRSAQETRQIVTTGNRDKRF